MNRCITCVCASKSELHAQVNVCGLGPSLETGDINSLWALLQHLRLQAVQLLE